jgi:hypothetical protein
MIVIEDGKERREKERWLKGLVYSIPWGIRNSCETYGIPAKD